ncbi:putative polyamine oxidase 4 [Madurella mycetomatis]|uniref:Putative polyamine oxidase 4 n=1 Tax=Madurella mycetomatis TaxID=100816 RepID=A0A175WHZ4_9PEZI|nr:putative polyamine oxidase 4 [Madurella mycetomatis]KXX83119.1 putative polyamine oxidase 4 [Madurella mycetomatis]
MSKYARRDEHKAVTYIHTRQLETPDPTRKPHIGIIGAGFAGLRCADVLLRNGFRVTILEARNRLGGRIYQEKLPSGHLIDAGANWIHGTTDNPIMDLVRETNTAFGVWDSPTYVFDEDGQLLSLEQGEKYSTLMWSIIEDAFEYSNKHGSEIDPDRTLLDFFQEQVVKRIPDAEEDHEGRRRILLQMAELWGSFVGSPLGTQSLKFFWLEECIEGENLFCAGTYRKVLEKVAQPAMESADIRYQTRVSEIYGKSTSQNDMARVKTTDGQVLEFDQVVVTCPLGWLKQNMQDFYPPLPDRLCKAIQNIGYGNLEKVYISFPTAFWLTPSPDGGRTVQGFCQWLAPRYAPSSNPERWLNEVVELGSLGGPGTAHPTLLFYTYGDQSRHLTSTLRSLATVKEKSDFLFGYFKPYYSRLPSYEEGNPDCQPTACFATDWSGDELAGNGSYANFQKGLADGDKDIETMRGGVPGEGVWLAGEHTAPFVALGTVTGAYWSGEAVARRIGGCYR